MNSFHFEAILQNRGVIVQPQNQEMQTSATMNRFALNLPNDYPVQGGSDLISHLRGYLYWEEATQRGVEVDLDEELSWCQEQFISLYWLRETQDLVISVRESLAHQGICSPPTRQEKNKARLNKSNLIISDDMRNEFEKNDSIGDIDRAIQTLDLATAHDEDEIFDRIKIDEI